MAFAAKSNAGDARSGGGVGSRWPGSRSRHRPAELPRRTSKSRVARAAREYSRLLLADEPTGNPDSATGMEVMTEILRQAAAGMAFVLVTHDEELAKRSSDRVLHMQDGVLV